MGAGRRPQRVIRRLCQERRFGTREPGDARGMPVAAALPGAGGLIVGGLACVVAIIVLLWIPVLSDRFTAFVSANGPKAAPKIIVVGLGFLLTGLVTHVEALVLVGAGLIGLLLLAYIYDNY